MKRKLWKKWIATALAAALLIPTLGACGQDDTKPADRAEADGMVNTAYEGEEELITVAGNTVQVNDERLIPFPEFGFALLMPDAWEAIDDLNLVIAEDGACLTFLPPSLMPDWENMTEEELNNFSYEDFEAIYAKQIPFVKTFFVSSDIPQEDVISDTEEYQMVEKLASLDGLTYYLAYNETVTPEEYSDLTQEDLEIFTKYAAALPELRDNAIIFPPQESDDTTEAEGVAAEGMQLLQGTDMNGNAVDASIFAEYDLTMVNIWATWCGPCVNELPDLADLYKMLPDNVNLITICTDADEEKETAAAFLQDSGAEFTTICGDSFIMSNILQNVYTYPTTVFVDSNGVLVGDAVLGSQSAEDYLSEIEDRL